MRIGSRVVIGEIKERSEAKKIYRKAKAAGKKAALVEQERPNLFTQSVANIAPGEEVEVSIQILHRVKFEAGGFSFRLPTTLTPRYIPGEPLERDQSYAISSNSTGWAQPTDQVTDADRITPYMLPGKSFADYEQGIKNPISIALKLNAGLPLSAIDSPFHQVSINKQDQTHHIELTQAETAMNRDFVLQWTAQKDAVPQAAVFKQSIEDDNYYSLMLVPPQLQQGAQNTDTRNYIHYRHFWLYGRRIHSPG